MSVFAEKDKPVLQAKSALYAHPDRVLTAPSFRLHPIIHLQRAIGNRAVRKLLQRTAACGKREADEIASIAAVPRSIQTKLAINTPGDEYEQEADRVADQVMRTDQDLASIAPAEFAVQRKCAECEEEEKKQKASASGPLQAVEGGDEEYPDASQTIFRKAEFATQEAPEEVTAAMTDRLSRHQSGGEPLPSPTLPRMENAFGRNFSGVRIHRDAEAGDMSREINALAFTKGSHIFFGNGMFDPEGSSGKRLLAHELTHVVQQGQAPEQHASDAGPSAVVQRVVAPAIQRVATWAGAGAVHQTNNLADSVVNGPPVGVTWPTLNGTIFWGTAAARAALVKPTVSFASAASGGVNASIATVPTNTGSFDETVLAAGPWTISVPKTTIGGMFSTLATCTGAGNSRFRAIGNPSDAHMFTANRRHEDHHATDHRAAFNASIVPWDAKLTAAANAQTVFNGANEAAAEAALHTAMGGTPDQIADAFANACQAAVVAFHSTPAGGAVEAPTDPTADADCSNSSAKYHNPS